MIYWTNRLVIFFPDSLFFRTWVNILYQVQKRRALVGLELDIGAHSFKGRRMMMMMMMMTMSRDTRRGFSGVRFLTMAELVSAASTRHSFLDVDDTPAFCIIFFVPGSKSTHALVDGWIGSYHMPQERAPKKKRTQREKNISFFCCCFIMQSRDKRRFLYSYSLLFFCKTLLQRGPTEVWVGRGSGCKNRRRNPI
jgi:hypothetical protein